MRDLAAQIVRSVLGVSRCRPQLFGKTTLLFNTGIVFPDFTGQQIRFKLAAVGHFAELVRLCAIGRRLSGGILLRRRRPHIPSLLRGAPGARHE
jgi:hypothetical protein